MKYLDAHCHILPDAAKCGVGGFIINATSPDDWATVLNKVERQNVFGAIGVHPWCARNVCSGWDTKLIELLENNSKIMVGEIGLDKTRPDIKSQESVFRRQLQIAHDLGRVVHIHCVDAWGLCMEILRGCQLPPAMLFHCFSGSVEIMRELAQMNAYFSFGAAICDDKKYAKMRTAVMYAPKNRILAESDAPDFLSPDAVPNTVREIARIRGVDVEDMAEIIYNNTLELVHVQPV